MYDVAEGSWFDDADSLGFKTTNPIGQDFHWQELPFPRCGWWRNLTASGMENNATPVVLSSKEVELASPSARVVLSDRAGQSGARQRCVRAVAARIIRSGTVPAQGRDVLVRARTGPGDAPVHGVPASLPLTDHDAGRGEQRGPRRVLRSDRVHRASARGRGAPHPGIRLSVVAVHGRATGGSGRRGPFLEASLLR